MDPLNSHVYYIFIQRENSYFFPEKKAIVVLFENIWSLNVIETFTTASTNANAWKH
jgi:hypothetical protein